MAACTALRPFYLFAFIKWSIESNLFYDYEQSEWNCCSFLNLLMVLLFGKERVLIFYIIVFFKSFSLSFVICFHHHEALLERRRVSL